MNTFFIIIHGPTGVGKTDFILNLGKTFPIEIINCDIGQMYKPLSIGTAKPDWQNEPIVHHLFDIITTPTNYSVVEYRKDVQKKIEEVAARGRIPVLVGGSGFYGKSLFFPPIEENLDILSVTGTWQDLEKVDPERAKTIHKNDAYRINRALSLNAAGKKASQSVPFYNPLGSNFLVAYLYKDRQILYEQINQRVKSMIEKGWIEEVVRLKDTEWEHFLKKKKLIGYPEILEYLEGNINKETLISTIQKKTRNYAKRQETFWKMFKKSLCDNGLQGKIVECDLSQEEDINFLYQKIKKENSYEK